MGLAAKSSYQCFHRFAIHVSALILILVAVAAIALGSTLSDYRNRVETAQKDVETMISIIQRGGSSTAVDGHIHQTIAGIRKSLPESEKLDLPGTSIGIGNGWLHKNLDQIEQEPRDDVRLTILTSISERLSAIGVRVRELEGASFERSKDEDKQKLAEILGREEYQKPPEKKESIFQRWLREFLEWLSSKFPEPNIAPAAPSGFQSLSVVLQFIIYGVVIALFAFLVYKFGPFVAGRFAKQRGEEKKSRIILGEHIASLASASDLFAEAERMALGGDLRGAIRKGYVALLCDLADRKVIGLARHKTNRDYLRDLRNRRALFERMKNATGSFERHWYGFRSPAPKDWEEFRDQYRGAVNEI